MLGVEASSTENKILKPHEKTSEVSIRQYENPTWCVLWFAQILLIGLVVQ